MTVLSAPPANVAANVVSDPSVSRATAALARKVVKVRFEELGLGAGQAVLVLAPYEVTPGLCEQDELILQNAFAKPADTALDVPRSVRAAAKFRRLFETVFQPDVRFPPTDCNAGAAPPWTYAPDAEVFDAAMRVLKAVEITARTSQPRVQFTCTYMDSPCRGGLQRLKQILRTAKHVDMVRTGDTSEVKASGDADPNVVWALQVRLRSGALQFVRLGYDPRPIP